MNDSVTLLQALGGEAGCELLAREFYARVGKETVLRPLFPGKSLRCATEAFAAFLIQFLGGDEDRTQSRWQLSLRVSHARFDISAAQRKAWLKCMAGAMKELSLDAELQRGLSSFFLQTSGYAMGRELAELDSGITELRERWSQQRTLDDAFATIFMGSTDDAIRLASQFAHRPSVFVGLLARMMQMGRSAQVQFALEAVRHERTLGTARFNGRTLLHHAAGAGCVEVVDAVLKTGVDPDIQDAGGHTALYRVANECATEAGPVIVRLLVQAGADVDACAGVTRSTALHAAARRGHVEVARALIDNGAALDLRDTKGATPLQRAVNCRRANVALLLQVAQDGRGRRALPSRPKELAPSRRRAGRRNLRR